LIKDRFHFAIMTISVLLAAETFCATIMFWVYVASGNVHGFDGGPFVFIGNYMFVSLALELVPVALLIWLLPAQNRKAPKRT
jgi:F0F1-type ATP synthase assembly protein I